MGIFFETNTNTGRHLCSCPNNIRPYKNSNDTSGKSVEDQHIRNHLILYAINDLFASTNLFFHLDPLVFFQLSSYYFIPFKHGFSRTNNIITPLFRSFRQSCKKLPSFIQTSSHQIILESISSLSWVNKHQTHLFAMSRIQTSTISSFISSSQSIMFLIGTNSIRSSKASHVLSQLADFILFLRNRHPHLHHKDNIIVVKTFPTHSLLKRNIQLYNDQIIELAHHLSFDDIHIDDKYSDLVPTSIFNYFSNLTPESLSPPPPPPIINKNYRSAEAVPQRNKRRHQKLIAKQKLFHLNRSIDHPWTIKHVKKFLQQQEIKFATLTPIHRNRVRIHSYRCSLYCGRTL